MHSLLLRKSSVVYYGVFLQAKKDALKKQVEVHRKREDKAKVKFSSLFVPSNELLSSCCLLFRSATRGTISFQGRPYFVILTVLTRGNNV